MGIFCYLMEDGMSELIKVECFLRLLEKLI